MMKFSLRLNVTPLPPISQITWLQPLRPRITTIPVIQVGADPTTTARAMSQSLAPRHAASSPAADLISMVFRIRHPKPAETNTPNREKPCLDNLLPQGTVCSTPDKHGLSNPLFQIPWSQSTCQRKTMLRTCAAPPEVIGSTFPKLGFVQEADSLGHLKRILQLSTCATKRNG